MVCPVNGRGRAQAGSATRDGAWLAEARRRKERTYPELLGGSRCRLVVLALEVGGRWSNEAIDFVRTLARAKARSAPELLRKPTQVARQSRWSTMLSVAAQRALAASLLELPLRAQSHLDDGMPALSDVLVNSRWEVPPLPSRLA